MARKALGRGIESLIPTEEREGGEEVQNLPLHLIHPNPYQPRREMGSEALEELKSSIQERGVIQPILVRRKGGGYEVISGHRRVEAVRSLGSSKIPAILREATDQEVLELALIENLLREDLNPIEEAKAYQELIQTFHLSQEKIAQRVGRARSTISNFLRLLELPQSIQEQITRGKITPGHARAILSLRDEKRQMGLLKEILEQGISVRGAETWVQKGGKKRSRKERKSPELSALERELMEKFGTRVRIEGKGKRGKVVIEYYSYEDLERIVEILQKG
ncbi:ParB/RepB/Spo0J family partition protein [candidate division TA06 bacterium]|nr:ParB/RepB/Spo0J family partition protein [candidate division TA06 bacterium]